MPLSSQPSFTDISAASASASVSSTSSTIHHGLSIAAKAGIAITASIFIITVLALLIICVVRRRVRNRKWASQGVGRDHPENPEATAIFFTDQPCPTDTKKPEVTASVTEVSSTKSSPSTPSGTTLVAVSPERHPGEKSMEDLTALPAMPAPIFPVVELYGSSMPTEPESRGRSLRRSVSGTGSKKKYRYSAKNVGGGPGTLSGASMLQAVSAPDQTISESDYAFQLEELKEEEWELARSLDAEESYQKLLQRHAAVRARIKAAEERARGF